MHPHYYWLKKAVRKHKGLHVFPYLLRASDFRGAEATLQSVFNIASVEELNDLFYIVVNSDKMKMPVGGRGGDPIHPDIPIKFCVNPIAVDDEDSMFDLFDINRGLPTKYFLVINDRKFTSP
jgi:hypothetical protein